LSGSAFLQQTFLSDREQKFILASAPKMKFALNAEYSIMHVAIGTRLTYFGKVTLLGYGQDGLGINPTVPLDNGSGDVPDQYDYRGKLVTDLYLSHPITKSITFYTGVDNLFNTHPDFGVAKGATDWAYNTETGGSWEAVQRGSKGRKLMVSVESRLKFNDYSKTGTGVVCSINWSRSSSVLYYFLCGELKALIVLLRIHFSK